MDFPVWFLECKTKNYSGYVSYASADSGKSWVLLEKTYKKANEQSDRCYLSISPNGDLLRVFKYSKTSPNFVSGLNRTMLLSWENLLYTLTAPQLDSQKVCKGEEFVYLPANPIMKGFWSSSRNGTDTLSSSINIKTTMAVSGWYYFISDWYTDSVFIQVLENFPDGIMESKYSICQEAALKLNLDSLPGSSTFTWSNGNIGPEFTSSKSASYQLYIERDMWCDTIIQFQIDDYTKYSLEFDTAFCPEDQTLTIPDFQETLSEIFWLEKTSVSNAPAYQGEKPLFYTLKDTNGCEVPVVWNVFETCPPEFYVPNAFHPDGKIPSNTHFQPVARHVSNFQLIMYNRWGQVLYSGTEKDLGWDGKFQGIQAQVGIYFYRIHYRYEDSPNTYEFRNLEGSLYLLRD